MKTYLGDSVYCEFHPGPGTFRMYLDNGCGEEHPIVMDNEVVTNFDAFKKKVLEKIRLFELVTRAKNAGCDIIITNSGLESFAKRESDFTAFFFSLDLGLSNKAESLLGWTVLPIDSINLESIFK